PCARGDQPDDLRRSPPGRLGNRRPSGSHLWPLPPQGLSTNRAELHPAPARILSSARHPFLQRAFRYLAGNTALEASAGSRNMGLGEFPISDLRFRISAIATEILTRWN